MAWLKAYEWEREKYPAERDIDIPADERVRLTNAIAKHMNVELNSVHLKRRNGGGLYIAGGYIWLPIPSKPCSVATIYHEIAHALHEQRYRGNGHTGKFKNCIDLVYHFTRPKLADLRRAVRNDINFAALALEGSVMMAQSKAQNEARRRAEREQRAAQHRAERALVRKQPEFKLLQIEQRIKRLQSRLKRTATLIKSANRSAAAYRRLIAAKAISKTEVKS